MDILQDLTDLAKNIKMLILDVDGVLTDSSITLDCSGNELKTFNAKDGQGIKLLMRAGIIVAIITSRQSNAVARRAQELGIRDLFQGRENKLETYDALKASYNLTDSNVAYMGDDIADLPVLRKVALPVAPSDCSQDVRVISKLITKAEGGKGAVRELCETILKAKGLWEKLINELV